MHSAARRLRFLANALTALRLVCGPLLVWALLDGTVAAAAALFLLAVATDLLDGRVARRAGDASALGGFLDHVTDAAFVSLGLAALALRGEAPALLPALVALKYFVVSADTFANLNSKDPNVINTGRRLSIRPPASLTA